MAIKRVSTGYQIRWYDSDGRERKRTLKTATREDAEREERKILVQRDQGESIPDRRAAPTFAIFSTIWVAEYRAAWKVSTLEQYQQVLHGHLVPCFGEIRVSHITESRALQFRTALQDAGLSARRINLIVLVLKMIMKAARRRKWVGDDPLIEVKKLREPTSEVDPLGPPEVTQFLQHAPVWWRPYWTALFWTGARPGEAAALKWGDVDWGRKTFRIRARRYRGHEDSPKTKSSTRDVDMMPPVSEALKAQRAQQAAVRLKHGQGLPEPGTDYIFTGPSGGFLNQNYLREKIWYDVLTQAKLRRRNPYQTRHTFASNALAAGEDPSWVARMLGHRSTEMVFKVYARFIPNRTRTDGSAFLTQMQGAPKGSVIASELHNTTEIRPKEKGGVGEP